jgi:hypothetical protein
MEGGGSLYSLFWVAPVEFVLGVWALYLGAKMCCDDALLVPISKISNDVEDDFAQSGIDVDVDWRILSPLALLHVIQFSADNRDHLLDTSVPAASSVTTHRLVKSARTLFRPVFGAWDSTSSGIDLYRCHLAGWHQ